MRQISANSAGIDTSTVAVDVKSPRQKQRAPRRAKSVYALHLPHLGINHDTGIFDVSVISCKLQ